MMNSEAWHDLTGNAVKVLLHLMKLSHGNNGFGHGKGESGQLYLSEREAAQSIGICRNTASRALAELIDHGFLRVVQAGHFDRKVKHATVWRLTFEPYPRAHRGPTNEWRQWKLGEQNLRAQILNGSGVDFEPPDENKTFTGSEIGPDKTQNGRNQPRCDGSIIDPHIDMPCGCSVPARASCLRPSSFFPENAGGPIALAGARA